MLACGAEGGLEERFQCCDTACGDANADFDGRPDGEVGCAVEKVAFVGFEGGSIRETNDSGRRATTMIVSTWIDE